MEPSGKHNSFTNSAILAVSLFMLATAPFFVRWTSLPPLIVGMCRLFFTVAILLTINWQKEKPKSSERKSFTPFIGGGFLLFLHFYFWFEGVRHLPVAICSIIYATNPLYTAIGNRFFFKEKYNLAYFLSFIFSFIGIFIAFSGNSTNNELSFRGVFEIILAAIFYSAYMLVSKKQRQAWDNIAFNLRLNAVALFFFTLSSVILYKTDLFTLLPTKSEDLLAIIGMAIFPSLLGHTLFIYSLNNFSINMMSVFKLATPIISSFLAWPLLGEKVNSSIGIGLLFTVVGTGIVFILPYGRKMLNGLFRKDPSP